MDNLVTVREIYRVCKGGDLKQDLNRLRDHIWETLRRDVRPLATWGKPELEEGGLYFWPDARWDVRKDDNIAVWISLGDPPNPDSLEHDAWVALWVPEKWGKREPFIQALTKHKPKGFTHLHELEDPESYAQYCPLWASVPYVRAGKRAFDVAGFIADIVRHTRALVALRPTIDKLLQARKTKQRSR